MATKENASEKLVFQAEVKQLLHLMIHSLYSNKEIVIRELISNASDASDKLRFEALKDASLYEKDSELKIRLSFDKKARTLTISDNGIGMNREEVISNIGTIARSGTKEFLNNLTGDEAKDANLIGQFGVGFYSSFIIADLVTVITRRAGSKEAIQWESKGEGEYTISEVEKETRGTDIILHLKKDEDEFLSDWTLKSIIKKYSDHITLPIVMKKSEWKDGEEVPTDEDETVNAASALWARNKNDIKEEEYQEFYKNLSYDQEPPLTYSHNRIEGKQEYISLLYIPAKAPFDLFDRERHHSVKLYVKRIFIMEASEKLMPNYLRFIKGVIDSADLPLNVSREILQDSKEVEAIRAGSTKKVLDLLEDMSEKKPDDYKKFWKEFGVVMKEGHSEDFANREKIAKLFRFNSTHEESDAEVVSLKDYVSRMKDGQEAIYFITADSYEAAKHSPHLEIFKKKGIEVLLLSDRVDEWLLSTFNEFESKKLQSIAKGDLDLGKLEDEKEKEEKKKIEQDAKSLVEKIQKALGDKVKEVKVTHRLTDSPACLVAGEHDLSGNLERLLKAAGQKTPDTKPILEINPEHPLLLKLNSDDKQFDEWNYISWQRAVKISRGWAHQGEN